jgi:hypothetical protein
MERLLSYLYNALVDEKGAILGSGVKDEHFLVVKTPKLIDQRRSVDSPINVEDLTCEKRVSEPKDVLRVAGCNVRRKVCDSVHHTCQQSFINKTKIAIFLARDVAGQRDMKV